jgi:hypothetical protein
MPLTWINPFVLKHIKTIEMTGVLMRIASFSAVSWLGPHSPFLIVWLVNTTDAVLLTWCAVLKKDLAYSVLNVFWMVIGAIGIVRATGWL